jgi:hypothetical protein
VATLATAAILGALGCGEDAQETGDYRRDANAICAESERKLESIPEPRSAASLEGYLRRALEISREYDRRFRALEPPEALRAEHRRASRLSRRSEALVKEVLGDLGSGEPTLDLLQRTLPELEQIARESNALARRMGLDDCVNPLALPGESPEPS